MSTKWSNTTANKGGSADKFGALFKDEYAAVLLQGKNLFGDLIYSYVEVTLPNIKRLYAALHSGQDFNPSDFGTIVASGKGEPSAEIRAEMAATYKNLQPIDSASFVTEKPAAPAIPTEKKAWDEY